jgi:hypothetical protein
MKPLLPPGLFSPRKRPVEQQQTPGESPAQSIEHRFDPPAGPAMPCHDAAGGVSAQIIAERFLGEIQREWSRCKPSVRNLWQPPGE